MAKPTTVIHRMEQTPEEKREQDLQEIETALIENKAAILETLELMHLIQETELLNMLKALIAERNEVLHHLVTFLEDSDMTRSLKNGLLLFNTLGQLNVEEMEPLVGKLNGMISEVAKQGNKRGGYTSLLRSLSDPELVEGLNTALALLKGLGADPADLEDGVKNEEQQQDEPKRENDPAESAKVSMKETKWIVSGAVAGASVVAMGMLFRKR